MKLKCGICGAMEHEEHMVDDVEVGMSCQKHYSPDELCECRTAAEVEEGK